MARLRSADSMPPGMSPEIHLDSPKAQSARARSTGAMSSPLEQRREPPDPLECVVHHPELLQADRGLYASSRSRSSAQSIAARKLSSSGRISSGAPGPLLSAVRFADSPMLSRSAAERPLQVSASPDSESLDGEFADRLEHPEALAGVPDEALLDERLERVEVGVGDRLRRRRGCSRQRTRASRANSCCSSGREEVVATTRSSPAASAGARSASRPPLKRSSRCVQPFEDLRRE